FTGENVIQTTEAGTQGIVNARNADEIILGSFVVAGAIVKYIEATMPEAVTLVAMGSRGTEPSIEDELCASYIEESILGRIPNFEEMKRLIRESPSGAKFFDSHQPQYKPEDFQMSLELDRFDFIMKAVKEDLLSIVKAPATEL
ncbi:2-phosphosulfolactate phosphatase, partial [Candidatus Bathyarchaeota archaeon]|nr:2-phosphosulfolactate phosphatase [Candidatus Bathyarchaeota archaeon]